MLLPWAVVACHSISKPLWCCSDLSNVCACVHGLEMNPEVQTLHCRIAVLDFCSLHDHPNTCWLSSQKPAAAMFLPRYLCPTMHVCLDREEKKQQGRSWDPLYRRRISLPLCWRCLPSPRTSAASSWDCLGCGDVPVPPNLWSLIPQAKQQMLLAGGTVCPHWSVSPRLTLP